MRKKLGDFLKTLGVFSKVLRELFEYLRLFPCNSPTFSSISPTLAFDTPHCEVEICPMQEANGGGDERKIGMG